MKKLYVGNREVRPHELILANQEALKGRWLCLNVGDLCAYDAAKAQSPEAEEEFLARRKERNRIEAENPLPIKPFPAREPALPPLALSEMMVFMQKIAQDGLLLVLDENQKLTARGLRLVAEKWELKILSFRHAIKHTLLQINATHGDTDPLNLEEMVTETIFYRNTDRLTDLQNVHGFAKAVYLHSLEEANSLICTTFPD